MPGSASKSKNESIAEIAANLLRLEGEKIEVVPKSEAGKTKLISDAELDKLLDRSPEVFTDRGQGWTSGQKGGEKAKSGDVAFEVFTAPTDKGNDTLATMLAEDT
jgi:ATP-dependent DNA helicase